MSIRSKLLIAAVAASVSAIAAPAFAAEATTFGFYGQVPAAVQQNTSQFSRAQIGADVLSARQHVDNVWLPDTPKSVASSELSRTEVRAEGRSLTIKDHARIQAANYAAVRS